MTSRDLYEAPELPSQSGEYSVHAARQLERVVLGGYTNIHYSFGRQPDLQFTPTQVEQPQPVAQRVATAPEFVPHDEANDPRLGGSTHIVGTVGAGMQTFNPYPQRSDAEKQRAMAETARLMEMVSAPSHNARMPIHREVATETVSVDPSEKIVSPMQQAEDQLTAGADQPALLNYREILDKIEGIRSEAGEE